MEEVLILLQMKSYKEDPMSEQLTSTCDKLVKPQDFLLPYDVTV